MSNFNYMDRVPVKIAESFKPPPRLYQLPQVIVHKLQLPVEHYNEAAQYCHDFQLERKVLAKMPELRRMRQQEREARRERKERREQERLHEIEAKNKQMLGAVSYPSADDLSSSDSDSDLQKDKQLNVANTARELSEEQKLILPTQVNNFHNILQPTIIPSRDKECRISKSTAIDFIQSQPKNGKYLGGAKEGNVFNYKDFEEDTSSPFDSIELKTINDLDILAQVLHNTQLHMQKGPIENDTLKKQLDEKNKENEVDSIKTKLESKENAHNIIYEEEKTDVDHITSISKDKLSEDINLEVLENPQEMLHRVSFENLSHHTLRDGNIPNTIITNNSISTTANIIGNNCNIPTCTSFASLSNPQHTSQQQSYPMAYGTLYNGMSEQHYTNFNVHATQDTTAAYGNRNYSYSPAYHDTTSAYSSPRHMQQHIVSPNSGYVSENANNYRSPILAGNGIHSDQQQHFLASYDYNELKSKSVPDILKELSDEVRNSEIRRSRYYSFNSEEEKQSDEKDDAKEDITPKQSPVKVSKPSHETNYYAKLPPPAQKLAKNISSMGFPLERVAKISQIFGTDDKKIVEHLIPLSELMDLGFDEAKISTALMEFDNNKEKALEYLIS